MLFQHLQIILLCRSTPHGFGWFSSTGSEMGVKLARIYWIISSHIKVTKNANNSSIFFEKYFFPRKTNVESRKSWFGKGPSFSTIVIFGVHVSDLVYHVLFFMDLLQAYFEPDLKLSRRNKNRYTSQATLG